MSDFENPSQPNAPKQGASHPDSLQSQESSGAPIDITGAFNKLYGNDRSKIVRDLDFLTGGENNADELLSDELKQLLAVFQENFKTTEEGAKDVTAEYLQNVALDGLQDLDEAA